MRPPPAALSRSDLMASGLCIGCGACAIGEGASMDWNGDGQLAPRGTPAWRHAKSAQLARTCPFSPVARDEDVLADALFPAAPHRDGRIGRYEAAYVGHAGDDFRTGGSSGGMVSWVAAALLRAGLVDGVAHVAPGAGGHGDGRLFGYRISRSEEELRAGSKSRYYPVEMSAVLAEIRAVPGRHAVIGIPCFIKAVQLQRAEDPLLAERISYTLGLVCGHMKSARMIESFTWQMGERIDRVERAEFRLKDASRPANWYTAEVTLADGSTRRQDWWHFVDGDWGAGFFQSAACDYCDDVVAETADIAFGDAWVEPYSSDGRGTNVVVVRSPELQAIVERGLADGALSLDPVDAEFVVETQAAGFRHRREGLALRLRHPPGPVIPRKRVRPADADPPPRRRAVYWMRRRISRWSHRVFRLARRLERPALYTRWAAVALAVYQGIAYSRGWFGALVDRLERRLT